LQFLYIDIDTIDELANIVHPTSLRYFSSPDCAHETSHDTNLEVTIANLIDFSLHWNDRSKLRPQVSFEHFNNFSSRPNPIQPREKVKGRSGRRITPSLSQCY